MTSLETDRLRLTPFTRSDFTLFVQNMLTDPRVVEFYHSYRNLDDPRNFPKMAEEDFWEEFELARRKYGQTVWAAYESSNSGELVGWCGLLHGEMSEKHGAPELQYMIAGDSHGKGYATEIAGAVVSDAFVQNKASTIVATVDIPNKGSIRVLEKLGFEQVGQVHAYGSDDMYLYRLSKS